MKIICITPTFNESWIIPDFIEHATAWADHIIIRDQFSSDGTKELLKGNPKVSLIDASNDNYDELRRRQELFDEARKFGPNNLLVSLDADEFLYMKSGSSLESLKNYPAGTKFEFEWAHPLGPKEEFWFPKPSIFAMIDDGTNYCKEPTIHAPRVPMGNHSKVVHIQSILVLHANLLAVKRNAAKLRYYKCFETLRGDLTFFQVARVYNKYFSSVVRDTRVDAGLLQLAIRIGSSISLRDDPKWWDDKVCDLIRLHTIAPFSRIDIWGIGGANSPSPFPYQDDPRNLIIKVIHWFLDQTVPYKNSMPVKLLDKFITLAIRWLPPVTSRH